MIRRSGAIVCSAILAALVAGCSDDSDIDPFELDELQGRTTLQWQFRNTEQVFAAATTFTEQSINVNEDGMVFLLDDSIDVSVRESANSEFVFDSQQTIICGEAPDSTFGTCIIAPSFMMGGGLIFFFNSLGNEGAEGNFEFCEDLQIPENLESCTLETFSPTLSDGQMFITNVAATAAVSSLAGAERDSTNNTYAIDTMRYLEQGTTSTDTPDERLDFTEIDGAALLESVRALAAAAQLSTVAN